MSGQLQLRREAAANRAQFASVNHGKPQMFVAPKPVAADHGIAPAPVMRPAVYNRPHPANTMEAKPGSAMEPRPGATNQARPEQKPEQRPRAKARERRCSRTPKTGRLQLIPQISRIRNRPGQSPAQSHTLRRKQSRKRDLRLRRVPNPGQKRDPLQSHIRLKSPIQRRSRILLPIRRNTLNRTNVSQTLLCN